jgi:DNA repair/transcription protein MET18/MMS19
MSASPYFAKLALPLFLEKFTTAAGPSMVSNQNSPQPNADRQVDLMLSMAACFPTYGAAAVRERGKELWEGIKTEVGECDHLQTNADIRFCIAPMVPSNQLP